MAGNFSLLNRRKYGLYEPAFEKSSCGVGFLCNISGEKSNRLLQDALTVLKRLAHRGAVGADPKTGDGAGLLIQIPDTFFRRKAEKAKISLPAFGEYGTGMVFLPRKKEEYNFCKRVFGKIIEKEGQVLLGWRKVPVDNSVIGEGAKKTEPVIEQVFIRKSKKVKNLLDFERRLYIIRKQIEKAVRSSAIGQKSFFYITNLSCRTFSYKGLLMPHQVEDFFLDLKDPGIKTSIVLVHSRYSTNTFPTWDLAQPFRFLAHNGEINTLRGNINWMHARESLLESSLFGRSIEKIKPVITPGGSDSATIDNVFELLVLSGRSLEHAMMMLIPAAWENNKFISKKLRDFYKFHACFSEPWDGPAAIVFTDGVRVGAVLDRNGLRPARYIVTGDSRLIMASEVGVLDIEPENIVSSGRLEPGKMLFVDTQEKRIISDKEVKNRICSSAPYSQWLKSNLVDFGEVKRNTHIKTVRQEKTDINILLESFGYTREDFKFVLKPMAENGKEPIGSMGNDTPLAVFSRNSKLLYNYFKQLFAQVTNPAIDPIREEIVMSLTTYLGRQENYLSQGPESCRNLFVKHPILTNKGLETIRRIRKRGFKTKTISLLFSAGKKGSFMQQIEKICEDTETAIKQGYSFVILSDRGVNKEYAALPALLAVGAIHHYLVRKELRTQISIILETAEPKETHHFALLFGYGADCINPYLAYEAVKKLVQDKEINIPVNKALANYITALEKGILKILSKMGISTLQSYRGAQIFEALGIHQEVIDRCFAGTPSRIGGVDFAVIEQETLSRHKQAYQRRKIGLQFLPAGGIYQWKRDGEYHLWNPESIAALQDSVRRGDYQKYKQFARIINDQSSQPVTLRSIFDFKKTAQPVSLSEVEPVEKIVRRFITGAMSFGSISRRAHETLAIAMNRLKGMSNTGEGGEDPARFKPLPNGDSRRSAIKQVASGRFGVSTNYMVNGDELQIKIAQGAKPGEGGHLPGHKVSVTIARTRYTTPGVTLISPPPHHDIYSIEDLAQLIFDLKNTNPNARISVKLVSEVGVGTIAAGVAKGHADMILISGGDGGTGASPLSSIHHAGLPWELGLSETHQTLVLHHLRSRVRLQTDGQMRTGRDVAIAALLGAEEYGFCTAALIVLGCVMLRHCNLNNCSVGIATQDDILQSRFSGKPEYVVNYFHFVAEELREIMASLGIRSLNEMIGRTDLVRIKRDIIPEKAKRIDCSRILYKPQHSSHKDVYCTRKQDHGIDNVLDKKLISLSLPALKSAGRVRHNLTIKNINRTAGAMLSGQVCRNYGEEGLPEDTIYFKFTGIAGQSFGAWLAKGITFELEGMANDYVGKGISGGKIIIYPFDKSGYVPEENIIIGNTTFYGAISGHAYIRGVAGERFCIRNSGLYAVVEGVGDHGCEYMTGGRVIVLGPTGRNFAAGMSGGIAYVYGQYRGFKKKCNLQMVSLETLNQEDEETIQYLLNEHYRYTKSRRAREIIDNFYKEKRNFIKVMPFEYKRVLERMNSEKSDALVYSDG